MGNHNKSKPTGTIHIKTTPEPNKTAANVSNLAESTMLVLETGRTGSDQDTTVVAADANANAVAADDTTGASAMERAANAAPVLSPAEALPDTSPATTAPAPSTVDTGLVAAVADTKTKMEIATEIFKRLKRVRGITRKEVIDQFVLEAKLSKAGASTYYQLIKSKAEEK